MKIPAKGMDHPHYSYSAAPARQRLSWPNGARLAVTVYLYLEYWDLLDESGDVRSPRYGHRAFPDVLHHTWFEHGNRIDIFRVLEALDRYGFVASIAVNAMAAERYPWLIRHLKARGHEFIAHGHAATRMLSSRMDEAQERRTIADALGRIEAAVGERPSGWISQDYGNSARTPALLEAAGLGYVADWPNDDQPYMMRDGRLVSLPNHVSWDDMHIVWDRHLLPWRYPDLLAEGARTLHEEGGESGRFMSIGIHPWIMGAAHRIRYLEEGLARIAELPGIWCASAGEVAAVYRSQTADAKAAAPR